MTNTTATQNIMIGRTGSVVHLPARLISTDPLCGNVRSNGARQYRRGTTRPATCKGCLAKAETPATESYADKFARVFDL